MAAKKATNEDIEPAPKAEFKLPKTVGAAADMLYKLKDEKAKAQRVVDAIDEKITALNAYLIDTLPKSEQTGALGKVAKAVVKINQEPTVTDWDALYGYIKKNNAWELLQRRLGTAGVKDRWEAGKKIPGVGTFPVIKVSVTKL